MPEFPWASSRLRPTDLASSNSPFIQQRCAYAAPRNIAKRNLTLSARSRGCPWVELAAHCFGIASRTLPLDPQRLLHGSSERTRSRLHCTEESLASRYT